LKKIFMRTGVVPYETVTPTDCLTKNVLGGNSGNLLYQYSMVKALSTEGTVVVPSRYKVDLNDADRINQECSSFVIPLADAFRPDFMKELRELTELIKRLTIPCIVTGIGVRTTYEPELKMSFPFDEEVKKFVNAVLEKSSMLGLRGEITGKYLQRLGYQEEKDFTVIGCPSLYANGPHMKLKPVNLSRDSAISLNALLYSKQNLEHFITRTSERYPNHYFVGQEKMELRLLYTGCEFRASEEYPCNSVDSAYYQNERARFFINVPSWLDFMKQMDVSAGPRFHGNVAAILAGTPAILLATDARTREFMEYHKIPGIAQKDIREDMNLEDIVNKANFHGMETEHQKNFEHFVEFLNKNGLENIYQEKQEKDYFAERMERISAYPEVKPVIHHTNETFENGVKLSYDWLVDHYYTFGANYYLLSKWMDAKAKGKSVIDYFQTKGIHRIAIYGIHDISHKLYEELKESKDVSIAYVIEPDSGQVFHGIPVQTLEQSDFTKVDSIVVAKVSEFAEVRKKFPDESRIVSLREIIDELN